MLCCVSDCCRDCFCATTAAITANNPANTLPNWQISCHFVVRHTCTGWSAGCTCRYYSGHSDCLSGLLVVPDANTKAALRAQRTALGNQPGNMEAWLLIRSCRTLGVRVAQQCATAAKLVRIHIHVKDSGGVVGVLRNDTPTWCAIASHITNTIQPQTSADARCPTHAHTRQSQTHDAPFTRTTLCRALLLILTPLEYSLIACMFHEYHGQYKQARFLENHACVARVDHVSLESHPQHEVGPAGRRVDARGGFRVCRALHVLAYSWS